VAPTTHHLLSSPSSSPSTFMPFYHLDQFQAQQNRGNTTELCIFGLFPFGQQIPWRPG
jgi:hypothetical protein